MNIFAHNCAKYLSKSQDKKNVSLISRDPVLKIITVFLVIMFFAKIEKYFDVSGILQSPKNELKQDYEGNGQKITKNLGFRTLS